MGILVGFQTITAISSDISLISSEMLSWEKIDRPHPNL